MSAEYPLQISREDQEQNGSYTKQQLSNRTGSNG